MERALPFFNDSAVGQEVTLQGVELGHVSVPLHSIHLKYDLVTGPLIIGVRRSPPVQGVSLILENGLAGKRVIASDNGISTSVSIGVVIRVMAQKQVNEVNDELQCGVLGMKQHW